VIDRAKKYLQRDETKSPPRELMILSSSAAIPKEPLIYSIFQNRMLCKSMTYMRSDDEKAIKSALP
jgi:hypothetical protein